MERLQEGHTAEVRADQQQGRNDFHEATECGYEGQEHYGRTAFLDKTDYEQRTGE